MKLVMKRILEFAKKNWPEDISVPLKGKSAKHLRVLRDPQIIMKEFIVADLRKGYGFNSDLAMKVAEVAMLNVDFTEGFLKYLAEESKLQERFLSGEVKAAVEDTHKKKFYEFLAITKIEKNKDLYQKFTMKDNVFVLTEE
ncbi:hypothetical protein A2526_05815 [candidate division WOR-1 bacterium RIFOXYD2_FULL_36_8]|uniref:Uncharacterized protein n=1 Tax=candidate division WOR-1 bacterium RIFOXYB2_FULL_36_35 TaxID=1802578 RepID=A0A1F4RZ11_UNCSA|nr:MAG: hypothetical protein A2230_07715 [candidate division WOR-1 bacterium RIFOXYA2_FULL_36_21]OGC13387.1 MAG: hypothetical protein A2290_02665 [candidate division WOR-1 bacterium RIFOXYB2_FULL_36_35]OGC21249.1 MAG: hypothetical protein A2282_01845 [candidate division WOR-1 bacterium RIFOXYA12_FULL_36_13]OGC41507.1 MAG: hypothetical protein A2526_05815 [candidate division WOR-1 bacterium RIFOXYD2_FULL_36_8]